MRIICHGLKDEDFSVEFTDHKVFLGRDESNSVSVAADGISRFHALLIEENDELYLKDNDSLNGTFLNSNQVRNRQKLENGDTIQIGYSLIRVLFHPDGNVILDFMPDEQTKLIRDPNAVPPESSEPERTLVADDEIEHTMVASEAMLSSSSTILPRGSEIGKYVIIRLIGRGGMGEVYLARHTTLGILRALKVLSRENSGGDARFLERFLREAKVASEFRHPNVVSVMDVETDPARGLHYIVMEYVDGGNLRNSLSSCKNLSEEQAVVIVEAVASALLAAEEHKIVHRDIKPDNIMFTQRGEVKLADLGIAKVDGKEANLTRTNMMVGTPAYISPEQAKNAKGVDTRADIYSLGATFYEMLTGQQPYPGDNSIEILHKLFLEPVPDPRKINRDISAASASIVMKMLAKDPKDRFQNATELLAMLERTFPPHTATESAELIRKAVAGENQSNMAFKSGIVSSQISLWWLGLQNKWFVLSAAGFVFAICVLCILLLFLGKRPASPTRLPGNGSVATTNQGNSSPGTKSGVAADPGVAKPYGDNPLLVTTDQDIVNPLDNVNSLREALFYAQSYCLNETVSFEKDLEIHLTSSLSILNPVVIDGGERNISIIGPDSGPIFRVRNSYLTLKNLTLLSDCSGDSAGVMDFFSERSQFYEDWLWKDIDYLKDISNGMLVLVSVKDGGKAQKLWSVSNTGLIADGKSHIHRLSANSSHIKLLDESVMEDATLDSTRILVRGTMKKTTLMNYAKAFLHDCGTCEDITTKSKSYITSGKGTINGLKAEYDSALGYEEDCVLDGTLSFGGAARAPHGMQAKPKLGPNTDIVFDLTERSRKQNYEFNLFWELSSTKIFNIERDSAIVDAMIPFLGARSFTVQLSESQPPGIYLLADDATEFDRPISLKIGDKVYPDALSLGKSFTKNKKEYSLSLNYDKAFVNDKVLQLIIRDNGILHVDEEGANSCIIVTTDQDVVDPDDGVISLREALDISRTNYYPYKKVIFERNFIIRLSSPLSLSKGFETIDGEGNKITLIGPDNEPMFRVSNCKLVLKDLTLLSDRSGNSAGIVDATAALPRDSLSELWLEPETVSKRLDLPFLELVSVKDGGKAERLWSVSGFGVLMKGTSHLHRFAGTNSTSIRIEAQSMLENVTLSRCDGERRDGDLIVYGILKNATVSSYADVFIRKGGIGENIKVGNNGFMEICPGGTVYDMNVAFTGVCGYQSGCLVTGKISIGGSFTAPEDSKTDDPITDEKTEVIFDLTERTGNSSFQFEHDCLDRKYLLSFGKNADSVRIFRKANSCTIRIRDNQPVGEYRIAAKAADFDSTLSLRIGNTVYRNVLSLEKSFSLNGKEYSLILTEDSVNTFLTLVIRR